MKSIDFKSVLIGVFMASTILLSIGAADPDPSRAKLAKQSGSDRYTPTKLEWLTMWANTHLRPNRFGPGVRITDFKIADYPNTIIVKIHFTDKVREAVEIDTKVNFAEIVLKAEAKRRGWDKWLEIDYFGYDGTQPLPHLLFPRGK